MRDYRSLRDASLGPLCLKVGSGITPRGGASVYVDSGTALIRSQNVYNADFAHRGLAFLTDRTAEMMKGVSIEFGDILLNITGDSVARCCQVPDDVLPARVNQHVSIIRPDQSKLHPRFLMYFLVSPLMQATMLSLAGSGGTRKALTKTMIERFRVPLPDLSEQRKIAGLLSAYDDLIQNNRRRIALLEHAARELYREWFVRLRFPGHESTRIVDGLPDGWEKIRVRDLLGRAKSRKKIKKNDYLATGRIPCIDQSKEFIGGYTNDEDAKHEDPLPIIVFGDHTRILKFVDFPFVRGADGTQLLTPNRECISVPYLYFALDAIDLPDYSYARHLKFLKDQVVLIPANTIEDKFTAFVADAMSYVKVLREQNVTLASARDLLLPRLMSGALSV